MYLSDGSVLTLTSRYAHAGTAVFSGIFSEYLTPGEVSHVWCMHCARSTHPEMVGAVQLKEKVDHLWRFIC